jgi:hypothetical protein
MENKELNLEQGDYKLKEGLYLRKEKDNYRLIYPPKKDPSKPFNLKNIHWPNFIGFHQWLNLLIIALVILSSFAFLHDTAKCREIVANPYKICGYSFNQGNSDLLNITVWNNQTDWEYVGEPKEGDVIDKYNLSIHT